MRLDVRTGIRQISRKLLLTEGPAYEKIARERHLVHTFWELYRAR